MKDTPFFIQDHEKETYFHLKKMFLYDFFKGNFLPSAKMFLDFSDFQKSSPLHLISFKHDDFDKLEKIGNQYSTEIKNSTFGDNDWGWIGNLYVIIQSYRYYSELRISEALLYNTETQTISVDEEKIPPQLIDSIRNQVNEFDLIDWQALFKYRDKTQTNRTVLHIYNSQDENLAGLVFYTIGTHGKIKNQNISVDNVSANIFKALCTKKPSIYLSTHNIRC